ncbi:transmembrane protein 185B [Sergentomyia squamirostris]
MNLQSLIKDFNPSKFIVHCSLFLFTILFCLRIDGFIDWPYWAIFSPLWIWKAIATLGATVGAIVWCRYPHYRVEGDSYAHFKAMLISLSLHLMLLMFELLSCDQLSSGNHLWVLVFIPLIFGSVASVGACVWAVKHDRSFELELFLAVNTLQFVFLPLKLDDFVGWRWEIVFIPFWIVLCLSLIGVLYNIIFCGILLRTPEVSAEQKRSAVNSAIGNTLCVVCILAFQVLIADKLDGDLDWPLIAVAGPLLMALFILILLSFSAKGGNKWWFGIRKNFSQFILNSLPCLQEYGNIAYHMDSGQNVPLDTTNHVQVDQLYGKKAQKSQNIKNDHHKPVVPIINIDIPD